MLFIDFFIKILLLLYYISKILPVYDDNFQ